MQRNFYIITSPTEAYEVLRSPRLYVPVGCQSVCTFVCSHICSFLLGQQYDILCTPGFVATSCFHIMNHKKLVGSHKVLTYSVGGFVDFVVVYNNHHRFTAGTWRILLVQSFTARRPLLTATSALHYLCTMLSYTMIANYAQGERSADIDNHV